MRQREELKRRAMVHRSARKITFTLLKERSRIIIGGALRYNAVRALIAQVT